LAVHNAHSQRRSTTPSENGFELGRPSSSLQDIKHANWIVISPNLEPFEGIIKEFPLLEGKLGQKIRLLYSIMLSAIGVV